MHFLTATSSSAILSGSMPASSSNNGFGYGRPCLTMSMDEMAVIVFAADGDKDFFRTFFESMQQ
jgi:hypothetical protein